MNSLRSRCYCFIIVASSFGIAPLGASGNFVPTPFPFFPPIKGSTAHDAHFGRQILLLRSCILVVCLFASTCSSNSSSGIAPPSHSDSTTTSATTRSCSCGEGPGQTVSLLVWKPDKGRRRRRAGNRRRAPDNCYRAALAVSHG